MRLICRWLQDRGGETRIRSRACAAGELHDATGQARDAGELRRNGVRLSNVNGGGD